MAKPVSKAEAHAINCARGKEIDCKAARKNRRYFKDQAKKARRRFNDKIAEQDWGIYDDDSDYWIAQL